MLLVKYAIVFDVTDGATTNFRTPTPVVVGQSLDFAQETGNTLLFAAGALDQEIHFNGIDRLQMIYLLADQALSVKIVPLGQSAATTTPLNLLAGKPSLLSFSNVVGIFVSNNTASQAKLTFQAVGNDI